MTRPPPAPTIPVARSLTDRAPIDGDDDIAPTPRALGPQLEPDLIDAQIFLEVLDGAVRGIFSVALTLSAARSLTEGPGAARLDQALDELDDLVRGLRHTALSAHLSTSTNAQEGVEPALSSTPAKQAPDLVDQAAGAPTEVDAVLIGLWNDAVADRGAGPNARERITDAARAPRQEHADRPHSHLTPTSRATDSDST